MTFLPRSGSESIMLHHKVMDRIGFLQAYYVITTWMRISLCIIVCWVEAYLNVLDTSMHLQAPPKTACPSITGGIPGCKCCITPSCLATFVCHILALRCVR